MRQLSKGKNGRGYGTVLVLVHLYLEFGRRDGHEEIRSVGADM